MSERRDDDIGMESEDLVLTGTIMDPATPDHEVEDYTLRRETDSYIETKDSQDDVKDHRREHRRVRRIRSNQLREAVKLDYSTTREHQDNSEEDQIIRLPSETEMTDVPVTHQRSNSESMSNFFSMPGYRRNDCLNFSHQSRELAYMKHAEVFENWKYSDEERAFLRHRVETFTKEQCVIHCILGHMLMLPEEMDGVRHTIPTPDDARQALLSLAIGSHWDVFNLAIIMAFSEKLNVDGSINKNFQGPLYSAAYHHGDEFRQRVEHYFSRFLLDD